MLGKYKPDMAKKKRKKKCLQAMIHNNISSGREVRVCVVFIRFKV